MILDARSSEVSLDRRAQVVIVGAGACGLTIARVLRDVADVLIIEGGGIESSPETPGLLEGDVVGLDYPLTETRDRGFGGSTRIWAGYCALFDPLDFENRPWLPETGWPIGYTDVAAYYPEAARLLNVADACFDVRSFSERRSGTMPFTDERLAPTVWRRGNLTARFGEHWRREFETSANAVTLTQATVVDLHSDPATGRIDRLVLRTLNGRSGEVKPGIVVLACGGIDTARLLLQSKLYVASRSMELVGRCFMEHPHLTVPGVRFSLRGWLQHWTGWNTCQFGERIYTYALGLSELERRKRQLLNARMHIFRTPDMAEDSDPRMGLFTEQSPDRESRVTLSDRQDQFGMRRARLDWRMNELDWRSFETTAHVMLDAMAAEAGISRPQALSRDAVAVLHSNHQLGTTRMSLSSRDGVVDPDCRMHEAANCYIAGGGVFPTASWANPTMTVMALALRLGARLKTLLS